MLLCQSLQGNSVQRDNHHLHLASPQDSTGLQDTGRKQNHQPGPPGCCRCLQGTLQGLNLQGNNRQANKDSCQRENAQDNSVQQGSSHYRRTSLQRKTCLQDSLGKHSLHSCSCRGCRSPQGMVLCRNLEGNSVQQGRPHCRRTSLQRSTCLQGILLGQNLQGNSTQQHKPHCRWQNL